MKILIFLITVCASSSCIAGPGAGDELFRTESIDSPMTIEISDYKFSLAADTTESGEEFPKAYVISGYGPNESSIKHKLLHAEFQTSERLFAMSSYACDTRTIDLVIQLGPSKHAETIARNYYRVVFSPELDSIVAQFYDPSVSAVNAVLPLQSVEDIVDPGTGAKITCNGSVPYVNVKEPQE